MDAERAKQLAIVMRQLQGTNVLAMAACVPEYAEWTIAQLKHKAGFTHLAWGAALSFAAYVFILMHEVVIRDLGQCSADSVLSHIRQALEDHPAETNERRKDELPERAALRHLRNSFSHGRWRCHGREAEVQFEDRDGDRLTFRMFIAVDYLVGLAEDVLVTGRRCLMDEHNLKDAATSR